MLMMMRPPAAWTEASAAEASASAAAAKLQVKLSSGLRCLVVLCHVVAPWPLVIAIAIWTKPQQQRTATCQMSLPATLRAAGGEERVELVNLQIAFASCCAMVYLICVINKFVNAIIPLHCSLCCSPFLSCSLSLSSLAALCLCLYSLGSR